MSTKKYYLDPDLVRRQQSAIQYVQQPCSDAIGVVTWGTRGSKDVCAPNKMHYGGNTTCLEIKSKYFHPDLKFFLDAGGGMQPAGEAAGPFISNIFRSVDHAVMVGFTHYHWDHIVGLPFTGFPFIEQTCLYMFGPKDKLIGPQEAVANGAFRKPFFPIPFQQIGYHFQFQNVAQPTTQVGLLHKDVLGIGWISKVSYLNKTEHPNATVNISRIHYKNEMRSKVTVPLKECVKVFMHTTFHPDTTISYALEMPGGQKFVFLTDHELQESVSQSLLQHVKGADCLMLDCQYKIDEYKSMYTGWGHGCDEYAVSLCKMAGVGMVLLCHHDPKRTDSGVDSLTNGVVKKYSSTTAAGDYGVLTIN
ncbi:MAG: hypothetical protein HQM12_17745 [SAR324 cluster bacterium]|nr:hypothetical protein [SAR324 cluster bacterium]MBF0350788.1 hypothetical protein [SAR324 cluster bacterium]